MDAQKALNALRRGDMIGLLAALDHDDAARVSHPDGDVSVAVRFGHVLLTVVAGPVSGPARDMVLHGHDSDEAATRCLRGYLEDAYRHGCQVESSLPAPVAAVATAPPVLDTEPGTLPIPGLVTGPDGRPEAFHF